MPTLWFEVGNWSRPRSVLDSVPPTYETFKRYRLEAVVADSRKDWKRADHFYETAVGLTTRPASVMNNWGYSKLTRGQYSEAERLFTEAIRQDKSLFTAKNNLVLARAAQGNYSMPVVPDVTDRAGPSAEYDGDFRGQTRRCDNSQEPVPRSHCHASAALRRGCPLAPRARGSLIHGTFLRMLRHGFYRLCCPSAFTWRFTDMREMRIKNHAVMALAIVFVVVGLFVLPSMVHDRVGSAAGSDRLARSPLPVYVWQLLHIVVVLILGILF